MDSLHPHGLFQQEISFINAPEKIKRCSKCGELKPFSAFHNRKGRKSCTVSRCKQCTAAPKQKSCQCCHETKLLEAFPRTNTKLDKSTCLQCLAGIIEQKECSRCHQLKPLAEFAGRRGRASGFVSRCKSCLNETTPKRQYVPGKYPPNRESERRRNLKKYGITPADYEAMLDSQGRVCKVCKGPPHGKANRYHVDHDHATGKVRGILCHKCNVALGMVQDDIKHLKALITYLEDNKLMDYDYAISCMVCGDSVSAAGFTSLPSYTNAEVLAMCPHSPTCIVFTSGVGVVTPWQRDGEPTTMLYNVDQVV